MIAKTSEAALATCNKTDVDSYCGMFCREVRPADISDANARSAELRKSKRWLESRFSAKCASAEWNTPKKFRHDTPTAVLGRETGQKRKADFGIICVRLAGLAISHFNRSLLRNRLGPAPKGCLRAEGCYDGAFF